MKENDDPPLVFVSDARSDKRVHNHTILPIYNPAKGCIDIRFVGVDNDTELFCDRDDRSK